MEIGFNAGHSSETFLTNSLANVVSFDLGEHKYLLDGKQFMDKKFPGRHTLILGDSHTTIPFFKKNTNMKFDVLFIDGDHSYEGALNDLINCIDLAAPNATIIFDDVVLKTDLQMSWTVGPTKAWLGMISMGKIEQTDYKEYEKGRGMVLGKYK